MSRDDELSRLRECAYGPDADIAGDEAALARLDRLQNRREHAEPDPAAATPVPRSAWRRGRIAALVTGVAVVAAAATATVATLWPHVGPADEATVVATLRPDPDLPWLTQITSDSRTPVGGVRYDDYLGVAVVSVTRSGDGSHCLYLLPTPTAGAISGGCGAGPFPARAVLVTIADMPEALTVAHPPGTAVQFEFDGDAVLVQAADRYGAGVPPESSR